MNFRFVHAVVFVALTLTGACRNPAEDVFGDGGFLDTANKDLADKKAETKKQYEKAAKEGLSRICAMAVERISSSDQENVLKQLGCKVPEKDSTSEGETSDGPSLTTVAAPGYLGVRSIALQKDKKLIVLFSEGLMRFQINGAIDTSFNNGGRIRFGFVNFTPMHDVAIDSNDRIVAMGFEWPLWGNGGALVVLRYLKDGTPDTGFGASGMVKFSLAQVTGYPGQYMYAMALQSSGNIIVGGMVQGVGGGNSKVVVARLNPTSGALDSLFGPYGTGIAEMPSVIGGVNSLAIDSKGRIIGGGHALSGKVWNFATFRWDSNGHLDTSFGSNGTSIYEYKRDVAANKVIVDQSDRPILLGGECVVRLSATGEFDKQIVLKNREVARVRVSADGHLLVASNGYNGDVAFSLYQDDGSPVNEYGVQGTLSVDLKSFEEAHLIIIKDFLLDGEDSVYTVLGKSGY